MAPSLTSVLPTVLSTAEELNTAGAANEANTKVHIIEPILAALGWNLNNFAEVDREFKVFDGTFLDYALRIDGKPKLFVEAKALGRSLTDRQFIAQTVNYANNEGVVWCVLTNGIVYQVYKTNEPVEMVRKLLFEVDLRDAIDDDGLSRVASALSALGRQAVQAGRLDAWGEHVFTDIRVRNALTALAADPPASLLNAVASAIEGPALSRAVLKASLQRLLVQSTPTRLDEPLVGGPPASPPASSAAKEEKPSKGYDITRHTANKPAAIVDLFQHVDSFAMSLGADVTRRPTKYYIGYFAGKRSFFTVEVQKAKIYIYASVPPAEVESWSEADMRDVTSVGHFGMGDSEFTLVSSDQLSRLEPLIQQAYLRNRK